MPKRRTGLHKEVSSIFGGVPIQKNNGAQQLPAAPAPERPDYEEHPERDKERRVDSEAAGSPKTPAPSHLTPTAPEPQQPAPSPLPKEPFDFAQGRPKADAAIKTAKQAAWQQACEQIRNKLFAPKPGVSAAKQKTMVILVPVLFIVLIFVFTRVLRTPSPKATKAGSFGPSNVAAGSAREIDWQIPAPYPAALRDPMQFGSVTTARAGTGRLIVKGIVYSKDKPSAFIGNEVMHEGDKVLDATVVKINEDSVEFEMNGKRWTQKVQR